MDGSIDTVKLVSEKHSPETPPKAPKLPLLILHGIFGSKTNTRTVAKQLASRLQRDVHCLDLRNFGDLPHVARLDYPAMAADVEQYIADAQFPRKPVLIGHSMGAKVAMAVALRRPEVPALVVSVDNAPLDLSNGSISVFSKYVKLLRASLEGHKYTSIKDVDRDLAQVEPSVVTRQFLLTNLNRGRKDDPVTSKIPLDIIGDAVVTGKIAAWPYDSSVSRWTRGPVLFIRGTESGYIPDEALPDLGKYFPRFEVRDIKSGHWVISEKPKEFMDELEEFVNRSEEGEE